MKPIPTTYSAEEFEADLYQSWEKEGLFAPDEDKTKPPFVIMMPPPNATGTLHLGHANMLALEDIMIRYKRMQGFSALWLPGTDHAAIATQSVVEKKLQAEGMERPRETLGREGLLNEIRTFVEKSKDTIRNQVRKMGSSCDWSRERYTFSDEMNKAVNELFIMMFDDGLIYRGGRIVSWDPLMQTTVADDELEYQEEIAPFYTFQYGPFQISTSRPETKFGDKYVVMHPDDKRYKKYKHGDRFDCEWITGKVTATIIKDEAVDPEFGTGVMTITPWHDAIDFEIAQRHKLEKQQIIDTNGNLLAVAGEFAGEPIHEARPKIVELLKKKGFLVKIQNDYVHNVAVNYRGKGVVEPQIMEQWFVDVNKPAVDWMGKKLSFKEVMQSVVRDGMIKIVPERFDKIYFHWIDNLRDWCISRQIWWGHRIPVWYKNGEIKVGVESPGEGWRQDEDTLDTWFSSGLWTFSTLGWPEKTSDLVRFTPSDVLETGYDILFFWVARMILQSTYALRKTGMSEEKSIPFKTVYLHGLIRDIEGKKMSKSRPETCIDPLDMIQKYGTDAVRLSLVIGATPGNDMRLYEEKIAGFRNFVNKIWNGARFVMMNLEGEKDFELNPATFTRADKWILTRLNQVIKNATEYLDEYRFSEAGLTVYDFFWGDFCDWFLEMSKVHKNPAVLKHVLNTSLILLHPFMPFVTEAIWGLLHEDEVKNRLIVEPWPTVNPSHIFDEDSVKMNRVMDLISRIRTLRAEAGVEAAKKIHAHIFAHDDFDLIQDMSEIIKRMANLGELEITENGKSIEKALSAFVEDIEIFLPLADLIDFDQERNRITKEIDQLESYLKVLESKLGNPGFVKKAPPEVIDQEKKKLEEVLQSLEKLKAQLKTLA